MKQLFNVTLAVLIFTAGLTGQAVMAQQTSKVYTVDEIIEKAPLLIGQTVTVKGVAQHVCSRSGKKLFLQTADGKRTFRFNAGSKVDKFNPDVLDKTVVATGVVAEQRVSLEDLQKQETAQVKAEEKNKAAQASHCDADAKANGETAAATPLQRTRGLIEKLRKQIAAGQAAYLSYYSIKETNEYSIAQ